MLWGCLLLPSLPLEVFARSEAPEPAQQPFVVASGGHYPRVVAANEPARAAGIRSGQLISAALALAPHVSMRERDPALEDEALCNVATGLLAFTPQVSVAAPNAVLAEIGGSLRLFGGLPRLVERLSHDAQARGHEATLALAPTPTAALLFAHAGHPAPVLERDALRDALAPFPLQWLGLGDDTLATLKAAGITTFGAAQALPRDGLARRFGQPLVDTLDRALGRIPDPRIPYRPPPHFARTLPLPAPVETVEALGFGVHRLVDDLARWLLARGLGVTRLSLALVHERHLRARGMAPTVVTFALGAPARATAHLHAVLRERLTRISVPAPVEAIVLTSEETAPLSGRNLGLLPGDEADAVVVPLVERLRSRLGDDAVALLAAQPEHRPEFAAREALPAVAQRASRERPRRKAHGAAGTRKPPPAVDAPRPIWLLDEAQAIGALLEEKPWVLRDGPERIESGWWDGRDLRRDYFVAETPSGETVWIYRDHRYGTDDGEWFMHGFFA
jgi:protein ImuB